jgi:hypothetical protein
MHAYVASLMAVLLAVHAAVGCCWHHAHACETVEVAKPCCSHHQHEQKSQQQPCRCDVECEGLCQYVAPEKVRLDGPGFVGWLEFVAPGGTFADRSIVNGTWHGESWSPIDSGPPLRLNLLNSVWLI